MAISGHLNQQSRVIRKLSNNKIKNTSDVSYMATDVLGFGILNI